MKKTKVSTIIIILSLLSLTVFAVPAGAQVGVWRDINPDAYISPPANPQLNSLYMLGPNQGWAVGDSRPTTNVTNGLPAIFHYDGSTWNLVPAPKFPDLATPSPSAYNLTSVTFGPPNNPISNNGVVGNDGWAVGFNSTISPPSSPTGSCTAVPCASALAIHWDGVTWRTQVAGFGSGFNPSAGPLWSAFMVSSTDVWAVGQTQLPIAGVYQGVFWHWTGIAGLGGGWNMPQATVPTALYSVFMVSPTEGWAVGAGGAIYHYFGGSWNQVNSPVTSSLRSVFMLSPTDGWAAGDGGVIIHYSAGSWSGPVSPGTTYSNLLSIFMTSSTDGWAFGIKGAILHYSGGSWTALPSNLVPTSPVGLLNFNSAYFNAANDGWAVGTDGVVLHFDGVNYGTVTSPTINNFTSVSFGPPLSGQYSPNPNDGWAVGNASATPTFEPTIYHWNGFVWTKGVSVGTTNSLYSVFMINSGDVWTVGGGPHTTSSCSAALCPVILHFTGGAWNSITPPPGSYVLKSVFMLDPTEGWAVGEQAGTPPTGMILHWQVSSGVGTWGIFPAPSTPAVLPPLSSVFMLSKNEGWAVGDNATILHYTVSGGVGTWNLVTVSGTPGLTRLANLTSIFMLSPTTGWAVGGIQVVAYPPPPAALGSLSAGPVIIYWDGTKWEPVATPTIPGGITPSGHTSATLKSVFFSCNPSCNPNDGWTVGFPGRNVTTILHWDGVAWNHISLSPALLGQVPPILTSVYMTSSTNGWIVGGSPDFRSFIGTNPITPTPNYFSQAGPTPGTTSATNPLNYGLTCANYPPLSLTVGGGCGYKTPLSTMLRFSSFGVAPQVSVVINTVTISGGASTVTATVTTATLSPNVTISIKVTNNQGNPISGVNVVINGMQTVTNSQGVVTFSLPAGTYTVNFSNGATKWSQTITVTSGQTFTSNPPGGAGIPGFPVESIITGIVGGVFALMLLRRRRRVR